MSKFIIDYFNLFKLNLFCIKVSKNVDVYYVYDCCGFMKKNCFLYVKFLLKNEGYLNEEFFNEDIYLE